ncbi:flagellin N-terminal helical domain-containing protein [Rhizobium sp.]
MTSIITNTGAVSAVDQLRSISAARTDRQQEVATGLRVKEAKDNSAYWSIATIMKSDTRALSAARDALEFGTAAADTATVGMQNAIDIVDEIKKKLLNSLERGVSHNKVNVELSELKEELRTLAEASSFNGANWLIRKSAADDKGPQVVSGFGRSADGTVSVQTLTFDRQADYGTNHLIDEDSNSGILTNATFATQVGAATDWVLISGKNQQLHTEIALKDDTTQAEIEEMVKVTNAMLYAMTDAAADLGSLGMRIGMQKSFAQDLGDSNTKGVGRLVDADMDNSSAKLKAIDAQQSLTAIALSIANQAPLAMLKLLQ